MMTLSESTLVFDLDDTLYPESTYQNSGITAVSKLIKDLFNVNLTSELMKAKADKLDLWHKACELLAIPLTVKESFLWTYRLHDPKIKLNSPDKQALNKIIVDAKNAAILTDGRSISQRLKLKALHLLDLPLYISEEYQSEKPLKSRFEKIMEDLPATHFIYVADNPLKDFEAPNSLGWFTIGVKAKDKNIHSYDRDNLSKQQTPNLWVRCFSEIDNNLLKRL